MIIQRYLFLLINPLVLSLIGNGSVAAWKVNIGPVSAGSGGVSLKPKLDFGFENSNFNLNVGVGDVRDGISVGAEVGVKDVYKVSQNVQWISSISHAST